MIIKVLGSSPTLDAPPNGPKHDTRCGGTNPYTLTARLGPARIRGFGPLKDDARPGQPVQSPAQGVKADLEIKQDPSWLE